MEPGRVVVSGTYGASRARWRSHPICRWNSPLTCGRSTSSRPRQAEIAESFALPRAGHHDRPVTGATWIGRHYFLAATIVGPEDQRHHFSPPQSLRPSPPRAGVLVASDGAPLQTTPTQRAGVTPPSAPAECSA